MSELQIALIAIGALIIIAVLIINWWQERRFHRQVENSFSPLKRDALLDDPSLDTSSFDDALDDADTNHFSIGEEPSDIPMLNTKMSENGIKEPLTNSTSRFVKLSQQHGADEPYIDDNVLEDEASIEAAYDQLVMTKLDRIYNDDAVKLSDEIKPESDTSVGHHTMYQNDFKEIFDEVLKRDASLEAESDVIQKPLDEANVSLPTMLHGQMDLTALLYLATETSVETLHNSLATLFDGFDKPIFVHVLDASNGWHLLKDLTLSAEALNRPISRVACSIQLADRGGAVSRNSLNRFQLAVETFGLDINGHVEWQGAGDAVANANTLDAFCMEVDKTIGFHLVHGEAGAFTGTKLRGLAEAQGLTLSSTGRFNYLENANSQPSFVMFNRDDHLFSADMLRSSVVKGVTFQMDIPHVQQCAEAFNRMVQVARQMEFGLNAVLVDDNNKVLSDIKIEKIRQQLNVIQATMLVRGIVPGSDSALRLFS